MAHLKYTASRIHNNNNNNITIVFIIILFPSCAQCYNINDNGRSSIHFLSVASIMDFLYGPDPRTPDDDRRIKLLFCKVIVMFTDISLSLLILVYYNIVHHYYVLGLRRPSVLTRAYYSVLSVVLWPRDPLFEIWYLGGDYFLSRKQSTARCYDYTGSTLYLSLSRLYPSFDSITIFVFSYLPFFTYHLHNSQYYKIFLGLRIYIM